jgi:GGDEF domain-containing protein
LRRCESECEQTIAAKGDSAWRIARDGNANTVAFDSNNAAGFHVLSGVTPVNDGQWHFLAVTFHPTTGDRVYVDGGPFELTVSIGGVVSGDGEEAQSLLGRADMLLYEAKHRGRNCVVTG